MYFETDLAWNDQSLPNLWSACSGFLFKTILALGYGVVHLIRNIQRTSFYLL